MLAFCLLLPVFPSRFFLSSFLCESPSVPSPCLYGMEWEPEPKEGMGLWVQGRGGMGTWRVWGKLMMCIPPHAMPLHPTHHPIPPHSIPPHSIHYPTPPIIPSHPTPSHLTHHSIPSHLTPPIIPIPRHPTSPHPSSHPIKPIIPPHSTPSHSIPSCIRCVVKTCPVHLKNRIDLKSGMYPLGVLMCVLCALPTPHALLKTH